MSDGPYTCCQCLDATSNDDDWCDDCVRESRLNAGWAACDGCGEIIAPEHLKAATNVPSDYMPEDFRKRATTILCELCRTEGE